MIGLRDVVVEYETLAERVTALGQVSLDVAAGEFLLLMGASGSGKSTLLNVISGLQPIDSGEVTVDQVRIDQCNEAALAAVRLRTIGVVFQDNNLIPEFTASENVELILRVQGATAAAARAEAANKLRDVDVDTFGGRRPAQLSGGQRQRVGIARALAGGRKVLLADEPTGALDTRNSMAVFELLRALADSAVTVVVASHDGRAARYADRTLTIEDGRIVNEAVTR